MGIYHFCDSDLDDYEKTILLLAIKYGDDPMNKLEHKKNMIQHLIPPFQKRQLVILSLCLQSCFLLSALYQ